MVVNNSKSNLDFLNDKLIINNNYKQQPIKYLNSYNSSINKPHSSGLIVNNWTSNKFNDFIALYNDSAVLSAPFLVNSITNLFSRLDNSPTINASITSFPKIDCDVSNFDVSIFTSLLMLGFALIMPCVTFAVEIVSDKEVR